MWPYWLIFGVAAYMSLQGLRVKTTVGKVKGAWPLSWMMCFSVLTLVIGLRHEVGGDWGSYLGHVDDAMGNSIENVSASLRDISYAYITWFGANVWGGIYFVNLSCAILFVWGLVSFCRLQPRPWLALLTAVPYLITVVAMGYTRQGVAIGIALLGLSALTRGRLVYFLVWIFLAATFHKSVLVLVPLAIFSRNSNRFLILMGTIISIPLLFILMLQDEVNKLADGYISVEYESSGASIRIAMNALPAILFLLCRKRFLLKDSEREFWTWISLSALFLVVLLILSPSSTAVDRLALYWIPLQLFFWSSLPDAMGRSPLMRQRWIFIVISYCFAVQFIWLHFAVNSQFWIPYSFYPWVWLWQ
jgi:hypothetical protein